MAFFYRKSQRFGNSLETFGSQIFFLRFLKSIGWYGFSYGFLVVFNLFLQCFVKVITNLHLTNTVLSKTTTGSNI
jgi:hypothetical protein